MSKFEPDFNIINKHLKSGDFGIAKRLHEENVDSVLSTVTDSDVKKQYKELSNFPEFSGSWAIERTVLQSIMEAQKGSVLMSINYLKLFGELEYNKTKFTSGPNPETLTTSFISTYRRILKDIPEEYEGGFSDVSQGKLPYTILLGKYFQDGSPLNPTISQKSGRTWEGQWPQYDNAIKYNNDQISDLTKKLNSIDDKQFKEELIQKRTESLKGEFSEINENAQLKNDNKAGDLPSKRRKSFKHLNVKNKDNEIVTVNVEDDYNISVEEIERTITLSDESTKIVKDYLIIAKLKEDLKIGVGISLINPNGTKNGQPPFLPGNPQLGLVTYVSRTLPALIEDGAKILYELALLISKNNEVVGKIVSKHINNEFEFMDPSVKNKPEDDPLRSLYYSSDKMIFDGEVRVKHKILDINFKIEDAVPTYLEGYDIEDSDSSFFVKTILSFMSIPINTYTKMLDTFKTLMIKLMVPTSIPVVYADFLQMNWLKTYVNKDALVSYLGSTDGNILTSNLYHENSRDFDKNITDKSKVFYEELINKYIEQVSAIYNIDLNKIIL